MRSSLFSRGKGLLFLFLLAASFVHAQIDGWDWNYSGDYEPDYPGVFITKDFVNCGTGLKDSTGKWIVEPTYTYITHLSGPYFQVFLGPQKGVVSANNGQVIIPAVYNSVQAHRRSSGTVFEVYLKKKGYGVIDSTGKTILPAIYRRIEFYPDGTIAARKGHAKWTMYPIDGQPFRLGWRTQTSPFYTDDSLFTVSRSFFNIEWWWLPSKEGLIDNHGKVLFARKYRNICYSGGQYHFVRLFRHGKIRYARLDGTVVFEAEADDPFDGYSWRGNPKLRLNSLGYVPMMVNGKWGILSATGDTILPFIYNDISNGYYRSSTKGDLYTVQKDSMQGMYDAKNRRWLLEPVYTMLDERSTYTNEKDSSLIYLFVAEKNKKYGIILSTGQELLPFRYNNYDYMNGSLYLWNEQEDPVMVTMPGEERTRFYNRSHYSDMRSGILVETIPADNRFAEKVYPDGTHLFYTPSLLHDSAQLSIYRSGDEDLHVNRQIYDSLLHATAVIIMPMKPLYSFSPNTGIYAAPSQSILVHADGDTSFVYRTFDGKRSDYRDAELVSNDSLHSYYSYALNYDFSRRPWFFRKRLGLVREDGLQVVRPGSVYAIKPQDEMNGLERFVISASKSAHDGLIDGNGKVLLDTIYPSISNVYGNYAVTGAFTKKKNSGFHRSGYEYNVIDLRTGEKLLPVKRTSRICDWPGDYAIITKQPEGYLLYNFAQRRFVNGRGYIDMRQLDAKGNFYSVKTCSSKIGVIDANGKLVIDTMYTAMTNGDYFYRVNDSTVVNASYYTLYNDQSHVIFNAAKGMIVPDADVREELLTYSIGNIHSGEHDIILNRSTFCPALSVDSVGTLQRVPAWAQAVILDSLIHPVRYLPDTSWWYKGITCEYCSKETYFMYTWSKDYEKAPRVTVVQSASDSCLSVFRLRTGYRTNPAYIAPELFYNTLLYPDGPHPVVLDSLFKGNEWRKFITDYTLEYLNSHHNVDGNCSNPYMFPVMMKDRFLITKDGLLLYPPGYTENGRALRILFSWDQLKPYMRDDVKTKLGVK